MIWNIAILELAQGDRVSVNSKLLFHWMWMVSGAYFTKHDTETVNEYQCKIVQFLESQFLYNSGSEREDRWRSIKKSIHDWRKFSI